MAGLPSVIGGQRKTPRDLDPRGVCLDLVNRYLTPCESEPEQELHKVLVKSMEFYGSGDRAGAVPGSKPARNGDREAPCGSARDHDMNLLW